MRLLSRKEEKEIRGKIWNELVLTARLSACIKSQRGAVITKNNSNLIIGKGFNKPLPPYECCCTKEFCPRINITDNSKSELCFAIHAEQAALIDTPKRKRIGARMYHLKLKNGKPIPSGEPSCSICSKMILFSGISEFALWHSQGWAVYSAEEFNRLSH